MSGYLVYEYNMMIIERYIGRSKDALRAGRHTIEVDTQIAKPGSAADVAIAVDGKDAMRVDVKRTVSGAFPPAKRSTSASILDRRSPSTITTGVRLHSTERSHR